jgi:hypothetical protein
MLFALLSPKSAVMMRAVLTVCLLLTVLWANAQAQEKINTDRPDQSDGASVVDPGAFQFETEFYYNHFREGKPALISSSLLRYGVFKHVEARLLVEQGQERNRFIAETTQGMYPLAISAKVSLLKDREVLPDISVIGYLHIPVTNGKSEKGYWSPLFTLVLEKEFDKVTATANISVKQEAFESKWMYQGSGELKYEVSDKLSLFGEYFAQFDPHDSPLHNLDGGVLYYISPRCMVHLVYGHTIFAAERNGFINTGLAYAFH